MLLIIKKSICMRYSWELCQLNLTKGWTGIRGVDVLLKYCKNCDTYPFQKKNTFYLKRKLNKVDNAERKKTTPRGMIRAGPELLYRVGT